MIKQDVLDGHLARFDAELPIVKKLENDFNITWANRVAAFNTELSIYFIKPKPHMSQAFGFEQELLLAISMYPTAEARLIQAIEQTYEKIPAKGRVDQTLAIIVSNASDISNWLQDFISKNPQGRAYVGISRVDLVASSEPWFVRNMLVAQLFSRDLFEYTLPLNEDLFFFGRQAIVAEHIDAIRKSENRGLFGLRKTGKTSVLFKVRRQCRLSGIRTLYYDCKLSSIYRLSEDEFIDKICHDIEEELGGNIKGWKAKKHSADRFLSLIKGLPESLQLCIMFDEIEYISAKSRTAEHWKKDFIPFWQTLWSTQSQFRKFCFIIAGVNASIIETDRFDGVQNPMFGIVKSRYLTGFEKPEVFSLLNVLGKRMGLNFEPSAVDALYHRYGGHPLLTRMICSQINTEVKVAAVDRPFSVNRDLVLSEAANREQEIQFYCGHITSELEDFYQDEYEILELLAIGSVVDFNDFAQDVDLVRHLRSYGLVDFSQPYMPRFAIPVIQGYIAAKWRRTNGIRSDRYIVPHERRPEYVLGRVSSIIRDLRLAERRFGSHMMIAIFGSGGPAEAELFVATPPVRSRDEAVSFFNQSSRSLVEPIEAIGKSLGRTNYFFNEVKAAYPLLWPALNRIKTYRNFLMHLQLTPAAQQHLDNYLKEDFDGNQIENTEDGWFRLQSTVLDGLITGIQAEISKFN